MTAAPATLTVDSLSTMHCSRYHKTLPILPEVVP